MNWYKRLAFCLLGWGSVGVVYSLTDALQADGFVLTPSVIDTALGFHPEAIWLYLSFFIVIPLAYLLAPAKRVKPLAHSMQFAAIGSGVIFLIFPTTLVYPQYQPQSSLSTQLLSQLIAVDSAQNLLPSLHVSLSILAGWALWQPHKWGRNIIFSSWILLICLSILLLKRHLFIDLVAGTALATVVICSYAQKASQRRANAYE
ncbi:phosphatase PAP2 family protein [Pseudomonas sp. F1_0610]|uniref:phosphatase PAP2 family protein n=1 Tax=Pseudomonas sp. F1_0610 TaxID=3114284 RepID=UPI0039C21658